MANHASEGARRHSDRRGLIGVLALSGVLGIVFALRIPIGLPYDEPSYFNVTDFYRRFHRMPVLGHHGVTYEAQHPPFAFVFGAVGDQIGRWVHAGLWSSVVATRFVGGIELLLTVVVLDCILRRTVTSRTGRLVALVLFAATPMVLADSWSVSNDALSVLIGFACIELMLRREDADGPGLRPGSALAIGALVGIGMVTKITVVWLIPAFVTWLVIRRWSDRRRVVTSAGAFSIGVLATCGWWFVRNLVVYGHVVGSTSLAGQTFGAGGFHGLHTVTSLAKDMVTYLWVPTEYYRNLIHAPGALQAAIALVTVGVVVGAFAVARRRRPSGDHPGPVAPASAAGVADRESARSAWVLLGLLGAYAVAGYLVLQITVVGLSLRTAYVALPLWSSAIGYLVSQLVEGHSRSVRRAAVGGAVALAVALDVWALVAVHSIGPTATSFL